MMKAIYECFLLCMYTYLGGAIWQRSYRCTDFILVEQRETTTDPTTKLAQTCGIEAICNTLTKRYAFMNLQYNIMVLFYVLKKFYGETILRQQKLLRLCKFCIHLPNLNLLNCIWQYMLLYHVALHIV